MNETTKRVLIVVATLCFVFVAILYRNVGRFQPIGDNLQLALDTHTGRVCTTTPSLNSCSDFAKSLK